MRLTIGSIVLLALLGLAGCSGVTVKPNPTNPAFIGNYGPGSAGWTANPEEGAQGRIGIGL